MEYQLDPQVMAEDLSLSTDECRGSKARMLVVAEILRQFSDEGHGLTAEEIREVMLNRFGEAPSTAKIQDDIRVLSGVGALGLVIDIPSRGKATGYRCLRTFLSSEQARLAINMVRTCKFVTAQQRNEICNALYGLVSYSQQDAIARSVTVDERELPRGEGVDVFAAAEAFSAGIEEDLMVQFEYTARGLDGRECRSLNKANDGYVFVEAPVALVYSFGSYYAETWTDESEKKRQLRRLDRVRNARVTEIPIGAYEEVSRLRVSVQERLGQTFDMFGDGEPRDLFLKVSAWASRYVYDRFGSNISFERVSRDSPYGYVHVRVIPSVTFYRWLFGMGDGIVLVEPKDALLESAFKRRCPSLLKSHEQLLADYEVAVEGMRDQLKRSAAQYGMGLVDSRSSQ